MNFCTECKSYYAKPGTCNCFAEARRVEPSPWWYPVYPSPFQVPTTGDPFPESGKTWCGDQSTTTDTYTVRYQNAGGTMGGNLTVRREQIEDLRDRDSVFVNGKRVA